MQVPPPSFEISVFVPGKGWAAVLQSLTFAYTQRWSEPGTWPDYQLPGLADDVIIPEGTAVLMDVSPPPMGQLHVQGQLIFLDVEVRSRLPVTRVWIACLLHARQVSINCLHRVPVVRHAWPQMAGHKWQQTCLCRA